MTDPEIFRANRLNLGLIGAHATEREKKRLEENRDSLRIDSIRSAVVYFASIADQHLSPYANVVDHPWLTGKGLINVETGKSVTLNYDPSKSIPPSGAEPEFVTQTDPIEDEEIDKYAEAV